MVEKELVWDEPGEIFSAGILAFESLNPDRMEALLAAVKMDDELKRALISALGWINFNTIAEPARRLLSADLAFLKYLGLWGSMLYTDVTPVRF